MGPDLRCLGSLEEEEIAHREVTTGRHSEDTPSANPGEEFRRNPP